MAKWFRPAERGWRECCTAETIDMLGRESQGLERNPNKDLDDALDAIWGKTKAAQSTFGIETRREKLREDWEGKLFEADGRVGSRKRKRVEDNADIMEPPRRPLLRTVVSAPDQGSRQHRPTKSVVRSVSEILPRKQTTSGLHSSLTLPLSGRAGKTKRIMSLTERNIWTNCLIWICRGGQKGFLEAWSGIIPRHNQVHAFHALWQGCGNNNSPAHEFERSWFSRGIVLVDLGSREGERFMDSVRELALKDGLCVNSGCVDDRQDDARISIWIVDLSLIRDPHEVKNEATLRRTVTWSVCPT